MNEVNPPQFLPPEGRDAATGAVSLPFEARGMTAYSSCLRGCCWSSRDLYPFGPERLEETSVRRTAQVPESLRALGIDQHEYGAMLEDAKSGLANAAPPIGLCCAGACIFTFVLAPFSICYLLHLSSPSLSDKLIERGANRVEKAISARASRWRAVYGVETKLVRDVRAYLLRVWRSGALFGTTPEEAFYVKCDSETNPRYLIDAGQVNVQVGICPVKPAEFVIFSIGQWDGGGLIEEV